MTHATETYQFRNLGTEQCVATIQLATLEIIVHGAFVAPLAFYPPSRWNSI